MPRIWQGLPTPPGSVERPRFRGTNKRWSLKTDRLLLYLPPFLLLHNTICIVKIPFRGGIGKSACVRTGKWLIYKDFSKRYPTSSTSIRGREPLRYISYQPISPSPALPLRFLLILDFRNHFQSLSFVPCTQNPTITGLLVFPSFMVRSNHPLAHKRPPQILTSIPLNFIASMMHHFTSAVFILACCLAPAMGIAQTDDCTAAIQSLSSDSCYPSSVPFATLESVCVFLSIISIFPSNVLDVIYLLGILKHRPQTARWIPSVLQRVSMRWRLSGTTFVRALFTDVNLGYPMAAAFHAISTAWKEIRCLLRDLPLLTNLDGNIFFIGF
jgi:hypothetical protein